MKKLSKLKRYSTVELNTMQMRRIVGRGYGDEATNCYDQKCKGDCTQSSGQRGTCHFISGAPDYDCECSGSMA